MAKLSRHDLKLRAEDVYTSVDQRQYIFNYLTKAKRIRICQVFIFLVFIALWESLTWFKIIDPFVFSSPSRILRCFIDMAKDGTVFYHIGITLAETFLSFGLVILLGLLTAVLLWWNDSLAKILEPYLVVLNSLPKSALAPILIVWLGNNMRTIIVAAVSVAVFGTIITLFTNFSTVEEDKVKLIQTLGGTKKDVLFKVVLPGNIPSIISIMKVNIGLSLVGVIIGEFLAAKAGLGYLIIYGTQVFKLNIVIMSIVILCIMATGLYKLLSVFEKRYMDQGL